MAARFWVTGGTGNWNSTTNWSATTGGASGASVPGSADTATFNASSGSGTATLNISPTIQTLTCTGFTGTLAFGTNTITLNSTGTIFTGATTMTVTGTPLIICTATVTTTGRTINPTAVTEANSISFRITNSTATLAFGAGSIRDIDFTDGVNPTGYGGTLGTFAVTIYGSLKASTNMVISSSANVMTFAATSGVKTINTAGITTDRAFSFTGVGGTWQLQSNINTLSPNSTRACTLTNGTLDLNGYTATFGSFSSASANIRTLAFGAAGKLVLTAIGTVTIYTTATATNLTLTGSRRVEITGAAIAGGIRSISGALLSAGGSAATAVDLFISAGADSINLGTANRAYRTIDFTGFSGSTAVNVAPQFYGSLVLSSTMTVSGSSNIWVFSATDAQTIKTNGVTLDANITFDGVGGTWDLQDALTAGATRTLTLTNGTFKTNGYAVSCQQFSSSNTNVRTLNLGASTFTLVGSPTWNIADPTNMTLNAGTSTITFSPTLSGNVGISTGGLTYNNFSFPLATSFNQIYIFTGGFTANNFSALAPLSSSYVKNILFQGGSSVTITGTLTLTGANGNQRIFFKAYNTSTAPVVTAAAVSLTDTDFQNITAAGASINWTGTRLGNCGGNTNITFAASKNCYFNSPVGGNWSDNVWALTSGGAVATTNYPLPQDTAIFDNAGINAGSAVAVYATNPQNVGAVNFSALTNSITWNFADTSGFVSIFGNLTVTSFVAVTGTAPGLRIDATRNPINITSAGASFGYVSCSNQTGINSGYSVTFLDNFSVVGAFTLQTANLDLNGKTLTCGSFVGTYAAGFAEVRTIAFNGGQVNVTGNNATIWDCQNLTNFSYTGTPTVNFTYSGSTGTRVISNGNTAGATESNVVNINVNAGSDTISFSAGSSIKDLVYTGFSGLGTIVSSGFIYGNLTLSPTQTSGSSVGVTTFAATSGTKTITTNGVTIDRPLTFNGVGGTWTLQDALTMSFGRTMSHYAGTINTNGYAVTVGKFGSSGTVATGNRTLNLGASSFTCLGTSTSTASWQLEDGSFSYTVNAGTSTIYMSEAFTGTSEQLFYGGGKTYYNVVFTTTQPGGFVFSNTFNSISNTAQPLTLSFEAGSTQTVDNFNVSGTSGNLVTLNSLTPGTRWNIAKQTGTNVVVSYCSITDSAATPVGYWFAPTSQGNVDGGNNTGWNFTSAGQNSGFMMFL